VEDFNQSSFIFTAQNQVGTQEISVTVSDGVDSISRIWFIETQESSETYLNTSTQYLQAGTNTNLNITLTNNLWKGIVDVQLQDPSPLIVFGNTTWTFYNVSEGEFLVFPIKIFTPLSALGATGAAGFTISFQDQYGTNYLEVQTIGLIIRGVIKVSVFSSEITPSIVNQGETLTISATLLNTGNTNAIFTNASLRIEEGLLIETSSSKSYLGELEPDSPLPFSLTASINQSAELGEHLINCIVFYQDEFFSPFIISINFTITILASSDTSMAPNDFNFDSLLVGSAIAFTLGMGTIGAIGLIIYRRKKS
jgi:hypothetical protein